MEISSPYSCAVCFNPELKSPVTLPCGHLFCQDCATRAIQSVKPSPGQYWQCPNCRHPYQIVMVDDVRLPAQLFPHIFPRVPQLNPEVPPNIENTANKDPADLKAENEKLRTYCAMWRRRAEAHAAATLGVINIAQTAKQEALRIRIERDELQTRYNALKRKQEESDRFSNFPRSLLFSNDGGYCGSPTPSSLILDEEELEKRSAEAEDTEEPVVSLATSSSAAQKWPSESGSTEAW